MNKTIYVTSDRPTYNDKKDSVALFETGQNTGNLLFWNAIRNQLKNLELKTIHQVRDEPVEEGADYVLSIANAIRPGDDVALFKNWAKILEDRKPNSVNIIGVGAQARNYGDAVAIPDGLKYFLDFVSRNTNSIGVRGYFSADVLNNIGIKNVTVIGCPSLYTKCDRNFTFPNSGIVDNPKISVHSTPDVYWKKKLQEFYAISSAYSAQYVAQNEIWIMEEQKGLKESFEFYKTYSLSEDITQMKTWFLKNSHIFYNLEAWSEFFDGIDYSIGNRIHGCVISLLNGTRTTVVPCDTRTRELAEFFSIPLVEMENFEPIRIEDYYRQSDGTDFNLKYKVHYDNYVRFLEGNGLNHNLGGTQEKKNGLLTKIIKSLG